MELTRADRRRYTCSHDLMARIVAVLAEFDTKDMEVQGCSMEESELADLMSECFPKFTWTPFFPLGEASIQNFDIESVRTFQICI